MKRIEETFKEREGSKEIERKDKREKGGKNKVKLSKFRIKENQTKRKRERKRHVKGRKTSKRFEKEKKTKKKR